MIPIISDPTFYMAAIPAVILVGLAKGGLGGAMGILGVPLMALVVSPVQAAAILLPILILMDMVSLWLWRGTYDGRLLKIMLPAALFGVCLGWFMASAVTAGHVRLIVGLITLLFALRWIWEKLMRNEARSDHSPRRGMFWGMISGFTSFVAHAGGPPYQVYAIPLRHDPKIYTGTSVIFFSAVNAAKLVPYFALGQFDETNLTASLILMPVAPLATLAGAWIVRRMRPQVFYPFMYTMIFIISIKLIHDGIFSLSG